MKNDIMKYNVMTYDVMTYAVIDIMKYYIMKYDIMKYEVIKYDVMKYDIMTYDAMTHHLKDCARPQLVYIQRELVMLGLLTNMKYIVYFQMHCHCLVPFPSSFPGREYECGCLLDEIELW